MPQSDIFFPTIKQRHKPSYASCVAQALHLDNLAFEAVAAASRATIVLIGAESRLAQVAYTYGKRVRKEDFLINLLSLSPKRQATAAEVTFLARHSTEELHAAAAKSKKRVDEAYRLVQDGQIQVEQAREALAQYCTAARNAFTRAAVAHKETRQAYTLVSLAPDETVIRVYDMAKCAHDIAEASAKQAAQAYAASPFSESLAMNAYRECYVAHTRCGECDLAVQQFTQGPDRLMGTSTLPAIALTR